MAENKTEDILLNFLEKLITESKEQQILEMIFAEKNEDDIIEELIAFKSNPKEND